MDAMNNAAIARGSISLGSSGMFQTAATLSKWAKGAKQDRHDDKKSQGKLAEEACELQAQPQDHRLGREGTGPIQCGTEDPIDEIDAMFVALLVTTSAQAFAEKRLKRGYDMYLDNLDGQEWTGKS